MEKDLEALERVHGELKEIALPSGRTCVIRMQNGADDDILSNARLAKNGKNFAEFLKGIIVKASWKSGGALTTDEALSIPIRDRNCIMIHSRIFSISDELKFKWTWPDLKTPVSYVEDITQFVWPYGQIEFPVEGDEEYFSQRIKPYPAFNDLGLINKVLSSGKEIKMRYYDGASDIFMMQQGDNLSRNSELLARGLELKVDGQWVKVENFSPFSPKDMSELRSIAEELDGEGSPMVEIPHPKKEDVVEYQYLLMLDGFLFPLEM